MHTHAHTCNNTHAHAHACIHQTRHAHAHACAYTHFPVPASAVHKFAFLPYLSFAREFSPPSPDPSSLSRGTAGIVSLFYLKSHRQSPGAPPGPTALSPCRTNVEYTHRIAKSHFPMMDWGTQRLGGVHRHSRRQSSGAGFTQAIPTGRRSPGTLLNRCRIHATPKKHSCSKNKGTRLFFQTCNSVDRTNRPSTKAKAQHIPELAPRSLEPRGSHQMLCDRGRDPGTAQGVLQASKPRGMFRPANASVHVRPTLVQHNTCPHCGGGQRKRSP
jgi:hypothetical protein